MVRLFQRVLVIVALGVVLGLINNGVSPKGIPLVTPAKRVHKPEEFMPLLSAYELWKNGNSIFFDARSPEDYKSGHIAQALNLPADEFEEEFPKYVAMLTVENSIVIYCDGTECELSHRLADQLRLQGYTNTHILYNGWTAWHEAGYPVETNSVK